MAKRLRSDDDSDIDKGVSYEANISTMTKRLRSDDDSDIDKGVSYD